jgi:oligoribonuclease
MVPKIDNLIWIDLEMTGLDTNSDRIIEIATIVTDPNLNVVAEGPNIAIHQSDEILDGMDDWCTKQHTRSGLVGRVRASGYTEKQGEQMTLDFLSQFVVAGKSPMCGNSICQDRRFLDKWMPKLCGYFHYRNLDVSSIKILAQHWAPDVFNGLTKESSHLAKNDIYDSIAELKHYRQHFFKV